MHRRIKLHLTLTSRLQEIGNFVIVKYERVMQWHYWQGNRLAIHMSQVRVLAGHHRWASYLHLCASVTKQYNLVPAQWVISSAGKVTTGLVESN